MFEGDAKPADRRPSRRAVLVFATLSVMFIGLAFFYPDGLVSPLPTACAVIVDGLGFCGGVYTVTLFQNDLAKQGWRGWLGAIGLPFIALFAASLLGRMLVETVAFAGMRPAEIMVLAPVIDMSTGKSGPHAEVKVDPTSREIRVPVTRDLYDRLDAYRHPGRDCLVLTVQTGRFGLRRAVVPAGFNALGSESLQPCPPETVAWGALEYDRPMATDIAAMPR